MNREHGSYGNPIPDCPSSIPWKMIEPCEAQAQRNHDQSLTRLAERGGLSPVEAYAVLRGIPYPYGNRDEMQKRAIAYLNERVKLFGERPDPTDIPPETGSPTPK